MAETIRILLIEDNPGDARLVQEALRDVREVRVLLDHRPDLAGGIARAKEGTCDVALLDLSLPDSQGLATVDRLRAAHPDLPIVVLTGLEDERVALEALKKGAQDYLVKGRFDGLLLFRTARYAIERNRLRQELAEREQQYADLVQQSGDPIVLLDREGRLLSMNPAAEEMSGFRPGERRGKRLEELGVLTSESAVKAIEEVGRIAGGEKRHPFDLEFQRRDGSHLIMEANGHGVSREGKVTGVELTFRDVTARTRSAERLKEATRVALEASRMKSEFLANMSHEIRTPMNTILGMADLLLETPLNEEQRRFISTVRAAGDTLLNVINDILDLSKVESGRLELEHVEFELSAMLDETTEFLAISARQKGLRLDVAVDRAVPKHLVGDPTRLRQVLFNLVGNAIKFTDKGSVAVGVRPDPQSKEAGALLFSVKDTGIGIPKDKHEYIFELFTQADASITRKYRGTGLGLAICRRLLGLMGGRIWVESELGKGSTFLFTVRMGIPATPPAAAREAPAARGAVEAVKPLRVLLVEDSVDNQFLMKAYLKGSPHEMVIAGNGEEAVKLFAGDAWDVVLMDMAMPVMDGYTATREIRKWEAAHHRARTPILALTASAFVESEARTREAGCDAHLTKPIKKAQLLAALQLFGAGEAPPPSHDGHRGTVPVRSSGDRIQVSVEADLKDLVPTFLANREKDLPLLAEALDKGDWETVRSLGHKMKGSGGGYGFDRISELGKSIEEAAKAREEGPARKGLADLKDYLARVEVVFQ